MNEMATPDQLVLDIPSEVGKSGFRGSHEWWNFIRNQGERHRLDQLLGVALLDATIRHRLVDMRDDALLTDFGLSDTTKRWIMGIQATSLVDIAREVADNFGISA